MSTSNFNGANLTGANLLDAKMANIQMAGVHMDNAIGPRGQVIAPPKIMVSRSRWWEFWK